MDKRCEDNPHETVEAARVYAILTEIEAENGNEMSTAVSLAIPMVNEIIMEEIVTWIKLKTHVKNNMKLKECPAGMADHLKGLIEAKEFLFTESDMLL